jgi:hypothetical protein
MTKRECQADAKAQGARAVFVVPVGRVVKLTNLDAMRYSDGQIHDLP